ncbi:MAG: TetR/AcrR family transcriptional regulator [Alphaproteobacteria bacterium]|jgi:TetR/AcrR family transcriptional regulator, transcriptional repressor for nem operon|nr:TetR/AcrR family transcriptional regulator [Rhodospirillaceae bacterium]MDG2481096.1 TetR/AcrR family transcriptional regulator [Alphaproteobacteria bacterium]MBT6205861.1 TetR/AcrR family transcriptional regulator [Rhodospirillaceae bacterium]MBT6509175.1 TetR/AcrR family transcriptional regulator [Rhodospirillaceae bacterium]MBT7613794.1 TetR/AcrR family transcriptional regulator [Rhodospirillaceae bacterium]
MAHPRSFDSDAVLAVVMQQFWEHGFQGASTRDLVDATGVRKASLYAAFGDKQAMYRTALVRYIDEEVGAADALLTATGGQSAIAALFDGVIDEVADGGGRWGCFLCNASLDQAPFDPETATIVQAAYRRFEAGFERALSGIPAYARKYKARAERARSLLALYLGMRVLARGGASAEELTAVAGSASRNTP